MFITLLCPVCDVISELFGINNYRIKKMRRVKNHGGGFKDKATVHILTLFIGYSENIVYPAHNFFLRCGSSQLFSRTPYLAQ